MQRRRVHRQPRRGLPTQIRANRSQGSRSDNPNRPATASPSQACQRRLAYVTMPAFGWSRGVPHLPMLLADPVGITASTNTTQTKTCTFLLDGGCSISGLSIAYKM